MEPFKIQVEVKLSDETIEAIKKIALAAIFSKLTPEAQEEIEKNTFKEDEPEKDAQPAEAPAAETVGDMPEEIAEPAPAQAKAEEISDDVIAAKTREAVAELKRQKRSSTLIRSEIFAKYEISQSIKCPQERRAEFLVDLEALVSAK